MALKSREVLNVMKPGIEEQLKKFGAMRIEELATDREENKKKVAFLLPRERLGELKKGLEEQNVRILKVEDYRESGRKQMSSFDLATSHTPDEDVSGIAPSASPAPTVSSVHYRELKQQEAFFSQKDTEYSETRSRRSKKPESLALAPRGESAAFQAMSKQSAGKAAPETDFLEKDKGSAGELIAGSALEHTSSLLYIEIVIEP